MKQHLLAFMCLLMLAPLGARAQKSIYIPSGWSYNSSTKEYTQDGYSYSMSRKRESDNFVVFWSSEYGTTAPDQLPTSDFFYVNVDDLLQKAEGFYKLYAETLKFVDPTKSTTMSKYKCMIMLMHSTEWAAYGGGFDFVVPALWINPQTCKPVGHTIAHEVGHSFHYMCFAESSNHRNSDSDNTGFHLACGQGQAIWEQTAQWQAAMAYPQYMFSESYPLFGNNANYAFSHEWMRYQSYWFHYYICQLYNDESMVAQVWNTPMKGQSEGNATDFLSAFIKQKNLSAEEFFALYFDYALRCATFDFDAAARYRNNYVGRFDYRAVQLDENKYQVAYASAPQCSGFNVIELAVPAAGTEITTHFTGLVPGSKLVNGDPGTYNNGVANAQVSAGVTNYNNVSNPAARGFRVGYVFLKTDGTREYYNDNTVHCTGTDVVTEDITATVPSGTSRIFLVVTPSLTQYIVHKWDENITNDDQWPYQFEIEGTTASGVTPYFEEPEFEAQLDGRRIADVTLTYNVVLPPTNAHDATTVTFSGSGLNALSTAFQLQGNDIFGRIVEYSAAGPAAGQIMPYAARADGTLQAVGRTTNGDFGHWFNASGNAIGYGGGCVAYAEFTKSSMSAAIGQYPNANSNGTKRTIREALRYRDNEGNTATAYLVFNITFQTGAKAHAYLNAIDYSEPITEGITAAVTQATNVCPVTLVAEPGETGTYTLTDEEVTALGNAFNATERSLKNDNMKGYLSPLSELTTSGFYYYALKEAPTTADDESISVTYYNVPSVLTDADFANLYTYSYDAECIPVQEETEAAFKVAFDLDARAFHLKANADCPKAEYNITIALIRKMSRQRLFVAYFPLTVAVGVVPTGIEEVQNTKYKVQSTDAVYDLQGRRIDHPTRGIYIINGKKVLIK